MEGLTAGIQAVRELVQWRKKLACQSGCRSIFVFYHRPLTALPRGVMVTQEILILSFKVRVLTG